MGRLRVLGAVAVRSAVDKVIAAVAVRAEQLGPPRQRRDFPRRDRGQDVGLSSESAVTHEVPSVPTAGAPITSSHIESTIKQINRRVKGTEKFWDQGAEPLLVLAADHLSETSRLDQFWKHRRKRLKSMRCYQTAV